MMSILVEIPNPCEGCDKKEEDSYGKACIVWCRDEVIYRSYMNGAKDQLKKVWGEWNDDWKPLMAHCYGNKSNYEKGVDKFWQSLLKETE